jgi:hypothetical protein
LIKSDLIEYILDESKQYIDVIISGLENSENTDEVIIVHNSDKIKIRYISNENNKIKFSLDSNSILGSQTIVFDTDEDIIPTIYESGIFLRLMKLDDNSATLRFGFICRIKEGNKYNYNFNNPYDLGFSYDPDEILYLNESDCKNYYYNNEFKISYKLCKEVPEDRVAIYYGQKFLQYVNLDCGYETLDYEMVETGGYQSSSETVFLKWRPYKGNDFREYRIVWSNEKNVPKTQFIQTIIQKDYKNYKVPSIYYNEGETNIYSLVTVTKDGIHHYSNDVKIRN